eukprot:TRINITY_DN24610_c0_g1_i1.p1 TRINITY_DN24610_c0_g1~~TRINITY_DN24610_c0_g1_i1.p1  ORF type:complete len:530 (+),score=85.42 TRINITY_DN24610_c0_g1_i1:44-1633(+)
MVDGVEEGENRFVFPASPSKPTTFTPSSRGGVQLPPLVACTDRRPLPGQAISRIGAAGGGADDVHDLTGDDEIEALGVIAKTEGATVNIAEEPPESELLRGIRGWLGRLRLPHHGARAAAWCEEMGAQSVDDVVAYLAEDAERIAAFVAAVGLKPIEESRFRKDFKVASVASANGCGIDAPGERVLADGSTYRGGWLDELRHGFGVQIFPDGTTYEGQWRAGLHHGSGKFSHRDRDSYDGEWVDGKASGHGTYLHNDGSVHVGEWFDDQQHGHGTETWVEGSRYTGNFECGRKHGHGEFSWADGSKYVGEFRGNLLCGEGIYSWSDGRKFEGQWSNNHMNGKGTFTWSDGRAYIGEYLHDRKHGWGKLTWPSGRHFEGHWAQGKQHGEGTLTNADGSTRSGQWVAGVVRWNDEIAADATSCSPSHPPAVSALPSQDAQSSQIGGACEPPSASTSSAFPPRANPPVPAGLSPLGEPARLAAAGSYSPPRPSAAASIRKAVTDARALTAADRPRDPVTKTTRGSSSSCSVS